MAHDPQQPDNKALPASGFPFSPQDALDFMQRMWNPLGIAIPGFAPAAAAAAAPAPGATPFPNPAALFAALDPAEVDRKITELKIIENWLTMSLSMMQMSIKTMELQKASLEAMRGSGASQR
ncbi:MAG TPA: PhaM family polyhydroxyalkanoate granule multifunctional regulatory protein [Casimicrobiaceae bacterium]|nr:PhaM family polyhydroxyalkanoate granule multifunctional regulatory protein [Casimicrobiaceae bacterium]